MTKKKESLAQLAILQNDKPHIAEEEDDGAIEASKEEIQPAIAVKKPRPPKSQKQLDAFAITRQKGLESNLLRKQATIDKLKVKKEEKEERIVKTAIIIKKKQIKRERILDNVSDGEDDEAPAKQPRQKKTVSIQEPPAHQFVFV